MYKLPQTVFKLPINMVLFLGGKSFRQLVSLPFILILPVFYLIGDIGVFLSSLGISIFFSILALIGVFIAPMYLRYGYRTFNDIVESSQAPWLTEVIEGPVRTYYQEKWPRIPLIISAVIPLIMDFQFVYLWIQNGVSIGGFIWRGVLLLIGHFGVAFSIYLSLLALNYVRINSQLYDKLLKRIRQRAEGYNEGHDSILSKNNYEVVKVLADTPGLSIQSLGNIPLFGLISATIILNSFVFLLGSPFIISMVEQVGQNAYDAAVASYLIDTSKTLTEVNADPELLKEMISRASTAEIEAKSRIIRNIILIALVLSLLLSFSQILFPIISISNIMGRFRTKALKELDPFIYDEITNVALGRKERSDMDLQIIFILREYIYSMKPSPVNPFRILYFSLLLSIYVFRGISFIIELIG